MNSVKMMKAIFSVALRSSLVHVDQLMKDGITVHNKDFRLMGKKVKEKYQLSDLQRILSLGADTVNEHNPSQRQRYCIYKKIAKQIFLHHPIRSRTAGLVR